MLEPTSLLLGRRFGVRAEPEGDRARVVGITVDPDALRCPDCGMSRRRSRANGHQPAPISVMVTTRLLRWNKTRYRCRNQTCTSGYLH